jgi:DNA-directed RNA polymerase I, II, and III subunit RPABC2
MNIEEPYPEEEEEVETEVIDDEDDDDVPRKKATDDASDSEYDDDDDDDLNSEVDFEKDDIENPAATITNDIRSNFPQLDDDDDDEDDDDTNYDTNYLQKFEENIEKNIIAEFHPELQHHNYDEVNIMARVVRDENGTIIDPLHKTLPFITRYEKARILGERGKQINAGAKPFVEVDDSVIDGYLIAVQEFEAKKIPFIIKRPLPNGGVEYWRVSDLEILV